MPVVTSMTDVFPSALVMSVPVGNVTVIWLTACRDSPPVADVEKLTKYTVRAPAAADGEEIDTVGWVIWLPATTLYDAELAAVVSLEVDTETVSFADCVDGLMTPSNSMLT